MTASIQYLPHDEIDKHKWDQCITNASNGLIYAYSFYLDQMACHWDALVWGDYELVMPLTWNKKYGFCYLYQPPFTASLGVFGNKITKAILTNFIQSIPAKFRLIEIDLNGSNHLEVSPGTVILRNNYVLNLNRSYEELYKNFRENVRRNIKKSQQLNCRYAKDIPVEDVIRLSRQLMKKISHLSEEDYERFRNLFVHLQKQGKAIACGVYTATNELVASSVYFFSRQRAYYILVGNHPNSKTMGASHYLIDRFIYDYAGQDLLLDFEGSDIRNLAFFYSSFGAGSETYPALRINRLPWWARIFKRMKY